jgi:hypothetical protein
MTANWIITISAGALTYPLDIVRRYQVLYAMDQVFEDNSSWNVGKALVTKHGWKALYDGFLLYMFRIVGGGVAKLGYDHFRLRPAKK